MLLEFKKFKLLAKAADESEEHFMILLYLPSRVMSTIISYMIDIAKIKFFMLLFYVCSNPSKKNTQ